MLGGFQGLFLLVNKMQANNISATALLHSWQTNIISTSLKAFGVLHWNYSPIVIR
jgi:hypothetical protein